MYTNVLCEKKMKDCCESDWKRRRQIECCLRWGQICLHAVMTVDHLVGYDTWVNVENGINVFKLQCIGTHELTMLSMSIVYAWFDRLSLMPNIYASCMSCKSLMCKLWAIMCCLLHMVCNCDELVWRFCTYYSSTMHNISVVVWKRGLCRWVISVSRVCVCVWKWY